MKQIIYTAIIILLPAITITSCKRAGNAGNHEPTLTVIDVMTDTAKAAPLTIPINVSGLLSTETEVKLSFKTGGVIGSFPVKEGQSVKNGEMISSLDLSEVNSVVNQYRLALDKAERDLSRAANLYADSVATLEMFQNAQTARDMARSMLNASLFNRDKSVLKATSNGMVLKKLAEKGEIIAAGHPVALFAPDNGEWVISSGVSDKNIVSINIGDSAEITLDAFPGVVYQGTVRETGTFANPYTGTFTVKIAITVPDDRFRTGMTAKVIIKPSNRENLITVPLTVLTGTVNGAAHIYLVSGGSYIKKRIKTGAITGGRIVVIEGLAEGDVYITEGKEYLTPGCSLNINNR